MNKETRLMMRALFLLLRSSGSDEWAEKHDVACEIREALAKPENKLEKQREGSLKEASTK